MVFGEALMSTMTPCPAGKAPPFTYEAACKREPGAILTEYGIQQCDYRARLRRGPAPLHLLQRIREKGKVLLDRWS